MRYIKSFKDFIPTWIICVFMFFWIFWWTLAVAVILCFLQWLQRKKLCKEYNNVAEENKKLLEDLQSSNTIQDECGKLKEENIEHKKKIDEYREKIIKLRESKAHSNEVLMSDNAKIYSELQDTRIELGECRVKIRELETKLLQLENQKQEMEDPKWERLEKAGK